MTPSDIKRAREEWEANQLIRETFTIHTENIIRQCLDMAEEELNDET